MARDYPYEVRKVEQHGEQVWSRHTTLELARRAARRYTRNNPNTEYWVDHYGYRIYCDGKCAETVGGL